MKKKIIILFVFLIVFSFIIGVFFVLKNDNVNEKNSKEKSINFKINKIKYYSSCNAITNNTNYQNPEWNIKVYQYTDVAIYLDRLNDVSDKNYITNLSIKDFKINDNEEIYYLNPITFGSSDLNSDYIIDGKLEYNVINSSNSNNEQNYNIPIFFQDCSNPITLRFVNNLSDNYKISSDDTLIYNGSILEKMGIDLDNLNTTFSFNLEITTKDGITKNKIIELDIPLKDSKKSILDGDFEVEEKENINI